MTFISDILIDSLGITFVAVTLIVSAYIVSKYFKYNDWTLLFVGIAWFGMSTPWFPEVFKLILRLTEISLPDTIVIIIYTGILIYPLPIYVILWFFAFTKLITMEKRLRSIIMVVYLIYNVIFEILIIIISLQDISLLGMVQNGNYVKWILPIQLHLLLILLTVIVSGIIFGLKSLKTQRDDIKLKAKILLLAFFSFGIGAFLDLSFTRDNPIGFGLVILARIILITSSVEFYIGFILPKKIKEKLLK